MNFLVRRLRGAMAATMVLMMLAGVFPPVYSAEAAVANTISFQGRLLASPTTPAASTTYQMRFSIWSDADFEDGVDRVAGALSGEAWSEVQTVTTDSQGFFIADVGSGTALPDFDSATHRYLQAEVKADAAADTTYFLLDNMAFNAAVDRKSLINSAYAQNSKQVDGRDVGLTAGDVPYLNADGKLDRSNLDLGTWLDPVADTTAMNAISSPDDGSIVYNQDEDSLYMYDGTTWAKIGGDLSSQIATLTTTVANNSSDIATNAADIASNDTDIAANLAAIQSNDTDIAANLAAILSNDTDIAANLAAILSNDSDIADNATDIAANLAAIISNDTDIAGNATDIAANLAAILSNDTDIAANLAAILANDTDIAANLAAIQSNDTDIATNVAAIAALDADTYSQTEVDNIVSSAIQGLSWKDPVANEAALDTEYPSPTTGDTAYVTGTGEIFTYNGSDWVKTGADFFQTATTSVEGIVQLATDGEIAAGKAVQSNDSRLAQVATNTTNITTNAAAISSNDTDIAANLAAIQNNDTDIAANAADIASNDTDIAANLAAIQDNDTDIAANLAAIQDNDTDIAANLAAIQSNDTDIAALQSDSGDRLYTEENYVTDNESFTDSIDAIDIALGDAKIKRDQTKDFVSRGFDVFLLP